MCQQTQTPTLNHRRTTMKIMVGIDLHSNNALCGQRRQRQLLRKERLADGNLFSLLTAHANGRPLHDPFMYILQPSDYRNGVNITGALFQPCNFGPKCPLPGGRPATLKNPWGRLAIRFQLTFLKIDPDFYWRFHIFSS